MLVLNNTLLAQETEKGQLAVVDLRAISPGGTFPAYLMKFDTDRSLNLPPFPVQTHCPHHHCQTQRRDGHQGACGCGWDQDWDENQGQGWEGSDPIQFSITTLGPGLHLFPLNELCCRCRETCNLPHLRSLM